jgi:hypothetical protein
VTETPAVDDNSPATQLVEVCFQPLFIITGAGTGVRRLRPGGIDCAGNGIPTFAQGGSQGRRRADAARAHDLGQSLRQTRPYPLQVVPSSMLSTSRP